MGGMNHAPYMHALQDHGARITINTRLTAVRRDGNKLLATLGSDFSASYREERRVDLVVVEHATAPLDDLYFALKPLSANLGAVHYAGLISGHGEVLPQQNSDGQFLLYRIGDAVAARNIHAGIYDALRLGLRW
jgi:hypothetical protein